jgi:hypothetical protein
MRSDNRPSDTWDRLAAELKACREAQRRAWGDTDNLLLGRYLADDLTPEERNRVESSLKEHPDLQLLTDVVREVMADCPAEEPPAILPFRKPQNKPKAIWLTRRRVALAAACLLLAVGLPVAGFFALNQAPPNFSGRPVALNSASTQQDRGPVPEIASKETKPQLPTPLLDPPGGPSRPDPYQAASTFKEAQDRRKMEVERFLADGKRALAERSYEKAKDSLRKAVALAKDDPAAAESWREEVVGLQRQLETRLAARLTNVAQRSPNGALPVTIENPYNANTAAALFTLQQGRDANGYLSYFETTQLAEQQGFNLVPGQQSVTLNVSTPVETHDARLALQGQKVAVRFARYEQAMEAASRALETYRYRRAVAECNVALQLHPEDPLARAALERARRFAPGTHADRPHVTAQAEPTVRAASADAKPDEAAEKVAEALRSVSPVAGHFADTLRKWSERLGSKPKK